jgi:hypothetical protein
MKKSTKTAIKFLLFYAGVLAFIWVVPHYLAFVSSDPIDYYYFRKSVSDGYMKIVSRDTIGFMSREDVIMWDVRTGVRYKLEHRFAEHTEFNEPVEECYRYVTGEDGDEICHASDNQTILDFLNNKLK